MGMDRMTLAEVAKAKDPNGMIARVIEVLHQKNEIVQDAPAIPSNAPMGNRVTLRSSLPSVAFSKINQGVARSKSSKRQRVDTIGILSGLSEVDSRLKLVHGAGKFDAVRRDEDKAFEEAMAQKIALTMLYGDETTEEAGFTGLAPRLDALATAITGSQVHSMGSVSGSDGTSIFIVDWSPDKVALVYPEEGEGVAGLNMRNLGEIRVDDADGNPMMAYVTSYDWLVGLTVKDPRHIARLANIDVSDANVASPTQGLLTNKLIDILTAMPKPMGAKRVMYSHREIEAAFWKQARNNASHVTIAEYLGQPTVHFYGYPLRSLDQMSKAESTVS